MFAVVEIVPVVVAVPVSVEVEIRNVISTRFIAQALINDGSELLRDLFFTITRSIFLRETRSSNNQHQDTSKHLSKSSRMF